MATKVFSSLYLSKLTIDETFSLIKSTADFADQAKASLGDMPKAALTNMNNCEAALKAAMNKSSKSQLTDQLIVMNDDRKFRFSEIKLYISVALKGRDANKKDAAEKLKIFLTPYWDLSEESMNTITGILFELISKYNANTTIKSAATTVGVNTFFMELDGANDEFDAQYKARAQEKAAQTGPSGSDLKPDAAKSYEQFCTSIEQAVNFTGGPVLTTLFNNMDELRKTYALLIHKTKDTPKDSTPKTDKA